MKSQTKLGIALWGTYPVAKLVEQVQQAEAIGLESVWVIDSQLICRDVFVTLAACLANTSRIKIGTGVTQPRTRHVSTTASALATLDEMFPGRVTAGVGTGFSSLRTLGMPAARLAELEQFVSDLRTLFRKENVEFENGVSATLEWLQDTCQTQVLVAASGPKATRVAAAIGDGAILLQGVAPHLVDRGLGWLDEGAAESGRDLSDFPVTNWVAFGIGRDAASAKDDVRARVASVVMQARPEWFEGADREAYVKLKDSYDSLKHAASKPDHSALISDRMIADYAIAGDAEDVREQLKAAMAHPRLDRVVLTSQGGSITLDEVLRVLGDDVLPKM